MSSDGTDGRGGPPTSTVVKRKVCLVGEEGVGKTSLIRRFVAGKFDEEYIRTLGAVVSKKSVDLETDAGPVRVDMVILDITGKRTFMQMFREAYFRGAAGVLAVFDVTRRETLSELIVWIEGVRQEVGDLPVLAMGNKSDLQDKIEVEEPDVESALGPRGVRWSRTSAKTGENVENAFLSLARGMVRRSA